MTRGLPVLLLLAASAVSAEPALVKDVNTTDARGPFTFAVQLAQVGGVAFFGFTDSTHGYELWRSDGTTAGTRLVKDLCPGACSSFPVELTALGPSLYFAANDGAHGRELWKTDGTEAGTVLVKDVVPGLSGSSPRSLFELDGSLLFDALTPEGGQALWISDGTGEGTGLLKTFPAPVFPLAPLGSTLLLGTQGGLWSTDGTEAGTVLLKNITPAEPNTFLSGQSPCAVFGGRLYLSADDGASGYEPWSTDGTPAGTVLVKDIAAGANGSFPRSLTVLGDRLLFSTNGSALWRTDGTEAGTVQVKDVSATEMAVLGTQALFRSYNSPSGAELWKTDGTEAGTVLVKPIGPGTGINLIFGLTPMPDRVVFLADDGVHGFEPWASDATGAGTQRLADLSPSPPDPFELSNLLADRRIVAGGLWYYRNLDSDGSIEMFVTDGTAAGTRQLTEINHHASAFYLSPFSGFTQPKALADLNGTLLFQADDGTSGVELWKTDGTVPGTAQVADLAPGPNGSYPFDLTTLGSRTLFNAGALWTSDGTAAGTSQVAALDPRNLTRAGNRAYFVSDGALYKTDGTAPGTVTLHSAPYLYQLTAFGNLLLFGSQDSGAAVLWRTDGTAAGTFALGPLNPGFLHPVGSRVFFAAEDAAAGRELWVTDGTVAGTARVKDIRPGTGSGILSPPYESAGSPEDWADLGGRLLFPADDGTGDGEELWISDGTAPGPFQLADVNAMPGGLSEIRWLTGAVNKVYFVADDGTHGREPWVTDGTWTGTRMVADLVPGEGSSLPEQLWPVGTQLLFSAAMPDAGRELWITDGDAVGTRRLADLAPGAEPSTPQAFTASNGRVYFVATDAETGFELYSVPRNEVDGSADFYTLPPCRLVDTRQSGGPLTPNVPRAFDAAGRCGIPATAKALAVNVTAIGLAGQGSVAVYRAQTPVPGTSTVSVSAGQNRAAGAMIQLGDGSFDAVADTEALSVHLVVDVAGYFQ